MILFAMLCAIIYGTACFYVKHPFVRIMFIVIWMLSVLVIIKELLITFGVFKCLAS